MSSLFTSDVFVTWAFFTVLGVIVTIQTGSIVYALLFPHIGALLGIVFDELSSDDEEEGQIFKR